MKSRNDILSKPKTKITTRRWRREDIPEIIECSRATYHDYSEEYIYTERQYHTRAIGSFEDLERSVEFFVDSADSYHCHFLLFPEYFTYQLLSFKKRLSMKEAAEELAGYTDRYVNMFKRIAQKYNIYIIGGSARREKNSSNSWFLAPGPRSRIVSLKKSAYER